MSAPYGSPSGSSSNGTLILILGILSIICLPILGPVAWIMGNKALPFASPDQAGLINGGRICGIIGTVLFVLGIIWVIFFGGMAMLSGHHTPATTYSP